MPNAVIKQENPADRYRVEQRVTTLNRETIVLLAHSKRNDQKVVIKSVPAQSYDAQLLRAQTSKLEQLQSSISDSDYCPFIRLYEVILHKDRLSFIQEHP